MLAAAVAPLLLTEFPVPANVIVARGDGRYEPVPVKIGAEQGGRTEILEGLHGGEKVVASGQFLIDSEASLRGVERRMTQ